MKGALQEFSGGVLLRFVARIADTREGVDQRNARKKWGFDREIDLHLRGAAEVFPRENPWFDREAVRGMDETRAALAANAVAAEGRLQKFE
jgi:hypothetical protein